MSEAIFPMRRRATLGVVIFRVVFWAIMAIWCTVMMIGGTTYVRSLLVRLIDRLP